MVGGETVEATVSSMPSVDILSEPLPIQNLETQQDYIISMGSAGQPSSTALDTALQVVGRQSWRQLPQQ